MDEFRAGLELTTTEELEGLTALLFHRRFNPLDYIMGIDSNHLPFEDRHAWVEQVDQRFRFLAADGMTVLRRSSRQLQYRRILQAVCRYLKLSPHPSLSTIALEEEVFLHMLNVAYQKLPPHEQASLEQYFQKALRTNTFGKSPASIATGRDDAQESLRLVLKGSSAVLLSAVIRPLVLKYVAQKVATQIAQYQVAKQALVGGNLLLSPVKHQLAVNMAKRGLAFNVARYSAVRGVFAILGPAMWTWFLADIGWKAIATNYGRIIPVIFSLAQIRLLRSHAPSLQMHHVRH